MERKNKILQNQVKRIIIVYIILDVQSLKKPIVVSMKVSFYSQVVYLYVSF